MANVPERTPFPLWAVLLGSLAAGAGIYGAAVNTHDLDAREKGPTSASQKGPTRECRNDHVGPPELVHGHVGVVGVGPRLIA